MNDYLARRDCEWMLPIYNALGVSAAYIQSDQDAETKRHAYECDITYGTSSEFGFDYLRDNMKAARFDDEGFHPYYRQVPAGAAELRHHRRGGQHPHRRGPHAADHLGDRLQRPQAVREGRRDRPQAHRVGEGKARREIKARGEMQLQGTEGDDLPVLMPLDGDQDRPAEPAAEGRLLRGQGEGTHLPPDRPGRARGREVGGRRVVLHRRQHGVAAPHRQRAEGAPPVPPRPPLHGRGRPAREQPARHHHHRRIDRPGDVRPAVVRRPAPVDRGQAQARRRPDQARDADPRHGDAAELLQALRQALRHDRDGHDRGQRVLEDLQARRGRGADAPAAAPRQLARPDLQDAEGEVGRGRRAR